MLQPFQCLAVVAPAIENQTSRNEHILLAAQGPYLKSLSLDFLNIISEWSFREGSSQSTLGNHETDEPRKKKQKLSHDESSTTRNVIKLAASPDGQHAVAVTDDKILHVFEVQSKGKLRYLSQRSMPKRPCALQALPDNATILCGDKFGDVYSLPLHPHDRSAAGDTQPQTQVAQRTASQSFKPSATPLTVHTERNRKALEAQLKQTDVTARRQPLNFDHELLLGHVSLLTDMIYTSRDVNGKSRGYIITADRDEHIRISRGPPQAHIIEGYCLGHREFVSKVCAVPGTDLLVSGGGDDWLGVWRWPEFRLLTKLDLREPLEEVMGVTSKSTSKHEIAVFGSWLVPISASKSPTLALVVACERVPALFACPVPVLLDAHEANPPTLQSFRVAHPVLDVSAVHEQIIVSLDNRSQCDRRLQCYRLEKSDEVSSQLQLRPDEEMQHKVEILDASPGPPSLEEKSLDDLFYGVANLRKRREQPCAEQAGDVEQIEESDE